MVSKYIDSNLGKIIISIIWGFGLACLFRRVCKGKNCIIIKGPNPKDLKGKIFKFNNNCFTYDTYNVSCKKKNNIPS